ncbi:hypothetical protein [Desulfocurvus sp. DL9XJH121]
MDEGIAPAPAEGAVDANYDVHMTPPPAPEMEAACASPACAEQDVGRIIDELV